MNIAKMHLVFRSLRKKLKILRIKVVKEAKDMLKEGKKHNLLKDGEK